MTNTEALDVVTRCVFGVSGQLVTPDRSLKSGGIVDAPRLSAFKSLVVTDPQSGVARHNHRIDSSALSGISIDDSAQDTADVVRANAVPAEVGVVVERPTVPVPERPARPRRRAAPKRAVRAKKKAAPRTKAATKKAATKKAATKKAATRKASKKKAARKTTTGTKKASRKTRTSAAKRARKSRTR